MLFSQIILPISLLVVMVGMFAILFALYPRMKKFGDKTLRFGKWSIIIGITILCIFGIIHMLMFSSNGKVSQQSAQSITSPIEIVLEEWKSWPDLEAPVGEFAYSKVPPGKKFDFDPLGKVYWTIEGSKKATLFTPGDPEPEYGTVWTRVGFMSLEEKPVLVLRKIEK